MFFILKATVSDCIFCLYGLYISTISLPPKSLDFNKYLVLLHLIQHNTNSSFVEYQLLSNIITKIRSNTEFMFIQILTRLWKRPQITFTQSMEMMQYYVSLDSQSPSGTNLPLHSSFVEYVSNLRRLHIGIRGEFA